MYERAPGWRARSVLKQAPGISVTQRKSADADGIEANSLEAQGAA